MSIDIEQVRRVLTAFIEEFGLFAVDEDDQPRVIRLAIELEMSLLEEAATPAPAWNGQGLPPVGTVCEASCLHVNQERDWFKTTIRYLSDCTAVMDDEDDNEFIANPLTMKFRPIRTPEQIQRDDLRALIEDAYMSKPRGHDGGLDAVAETLIAAGYHK